MLRWGGATNKTNISLIRNSSVLTDCNASIIKQRLSYNLRVAFGSRRWNEKVSKPTGSDTFPAHFQLSCRNTFQRLLDVFRLVQASPSQFIVLDFQRTRLQLSGDPSSHAAYFWNAFLFSPCQFFKEFTKSQLNMTDAVSRSRKRPVNHVKGNL